MLIGIGNKVAVCMTRLLPNSLTRRFIRQQDGAAAVEFGLIVAPFLALLFAVIETSIVFFAGQTLETATGDSARMIMTGQAQTGNLDKAKFKDEVCKRIYALFDCAGGVHIDVRQYSSFSAADFTKPLDKDGNLDTSNFKYEPGGAGCIVVVRVFYQWPIYLSLMGFNLADMSGNKRLISAAAAFRNEPYATGGGAC
jgi:Flp pilus assembly protein TadG